MLYLFVFVAASGMLAGPQQAVVESAVLALALPTSPTCIQAPQEVENAARPPSSNWPSFRGPGASGVTGGPPVPTKWDVAGGKQVAWKRNVPGLGLSSPVIHGRRLFLTTAVPAEGDPELKSGLYGDIRPVQGEGRQAWKLLCIDKTTGELLWERTAHAGVPRIQRHPKSSHANSTPATDGRRVVTFFGSEGLWCYTTDGELAWKKDLGALDAGFFRVPAAQWGFGSSPTIHDGKVLVQCDVQGGGFVAAFQLASGKELWRTPRDDVPTWSTPTVHVADGRAQVIVNGWRHAGAYDLNTGKELWKIGGGGDIPVPTPVVGHGLTFITNAHGGARPIWAIRLSATGNISLEGDERKNQHVAWSQPRRGNYMQTPLLLGDLLYCCSDSGVLGCYDARTGEEKYQARLGRGRSGFTASPVASGGHVFLASEDGDVHVIRAGPEFQPVTVNALGETCLATPAISEGRLYFRCRRQLIAIGPRP